MRILVDHPCEAELAHGAALLVCHGVEHVEQVAGLGVTFLGVLRHALAKVLLALKLGAGVVGARKEAVGHGTKGHVRDTQLNAGGEYALVPAGHHGIAVLDGGDGSYSMGAPQVLFGGLRDSPGTDLALGDELAKLLGNNLGLHLGVNAVLVVEVNSVDAQLAQALLAACANGLGAAVQHQIVVGVVMHAHLGGNDHLVAEVANGGAHELLVVRDGAVSLNAHIRLCGVVKVVADLVGGAQHVDGHVVGRRVAGCMAKSHAAQAHRVYTQVALAKLQLFHWCILS